MAGANQRDIASDAPHAAMAHPTKIKLERAQGECLGIRSRRRTRQAAISFGERHIRIDPEISEWGNPARQYRVSVR